MNRVCPKCSTENCIPDRHDPSEADRCDKCNCLLRWQPDEKEVQIRAKSYLEDLRKLLDDKLMLLDSRVMTRVITEGRRSYLEHCGEPDSALFVAVIGEVNRRFTAASWFWRRWLQPSYEYKKWVQHRRQQDEMADQLAREG